MRKRFQLGLKRKVISLNGFKMYKGAIKDSKKGFFTNKKKK